LERSVMVEPHFLLPWLVLARPRWQGFWSDGCETVGSEFQNQARLYRTPSRCSDLIPFCFSRDGTDARGLQETAARSQNKQISGKNRSVINPRPTLPTTTPVDTTEDGFGRSESSQNGPCPSRRCCLGGSRVLNPLQLACT